MLRWIRNIFAAVGVALFVCWILMLIATGNFPPGPPDTFTVLILSIAAMITSVLWLTGMTGLTGSQFRQRFAIILTYIEQAVRLNLPISRMLLAAEASEPRWIASRIGQLRKQLESGSSVADSLRKTVPGLSRRNVALITAAERVGRVGPELSRLVQHERTTQSRSTVERSFLSSYPIAMTAVIAAILSMVMIFVIPKFTQIFRDFKCPLPPLTVAVIRFVDIPGGESWGWLILSLTIALLAAIAQIIRQKLDRLGPPRLFTSNRDLADVCHVISESLEASLPLDGAIRSANDLSISASMKRKLNLWADGIERGQPTADSARAANMPRLIAGLTTTAEGFAFLSRYYASKFSRVMALLRAAAIPIMVFIFGILVAIVALTLFLPIIALIDSVGSVKTPFESWL